MVKSLTLALYLATRARSDRAARRSAATGTESGENHDNERLGEASDVRPEGGSLIWFHTGHDRHALAARELAGRMKSERDDLCFLFTTHAEKRRKSEPGLFSQLVPDDAMPNVRRFLDHWRPDIAIWTEPDLSPALITETGDREIPLFLVDAHTAAPDPQSWRWLRGMSGSLLSRFRKILTGDAKTANALKRLGATSEQVEIAGYLEEGTPALPCNEADRNALAHALAARPVWLAARITNEECAAIIAAHSRAQRRAHRLLLILVPDEPDEGAAWAERLITDGHRVAQRSKGEEPDADTQIYVADTEGEMGLWYRLAPVSFLGRSMGDNGGDFGGVNPYEPAALGSAIIHGPGIAGFRQAYVRLEAAKAARLVHTAEELSEALEQLLSPHTAATMAHEAWKICSSGAEVTDRVRDLIFSELDIDEED
ncbi:MAG: 3-deoxy-D-manno-octulosonic acid transferase [Rhodobacter sp.]|nr:3-deoxy-D-manno-octulosonic acid transferase [Rhodobacter sp.]